MSVFAVTIETIGDIREHSNADRLEMATLQGKDYDFIVLRSQFKIGEKVVYFPVDSVLPSWIAEALGLAGKLAGREKNRIKTVKLRGNISQGVVASPEVFSQHIPEIDTFAVGHDLTALLGVEKYEPPMIASQYGDLKPLPQFVSKYDIEGAQNHVALVNILLDQPVYITEKLEGSHWGVTWLAENDEIKVSQRNYRIEPTEQGEHDWHKVARIGNYGEKLRAIVKELEAETGMSPKAVTVRGEMIGVAIQGNYYKLKDQTARVFEMEVDGIPLDAEKFIHLAEKHDMPIVPILAVGVCLRDWLGDKTLKQASDGRSQIADVRREGIVIKPMTEQRDETVGRVVLKQRSPEYLSKSEY